MIAAIDDDSITVNIIAENTYRTSNGNNYIGGTFLGNTVTKSGSGNTVSANQEINPRVLKKFSDANNKPGKATLHKVTEAYQGAAASKISGVSAPIATNPNDPQYLAAHGAAVNQPDTINAHFYAATNQKRTMFLQPKGVKLGSNSFYRLLALH